MYRITRIEIYVRPTNRKEQAFHDHQIDCFMFVYELFGPLYQHSPVERDADAIRARHEGIMDLMGTIGRTRNRVAGVHRAKKGI